MTDRTPAALSAEAALREATARLAVRADALFVRQPLVDAQCPDTGDIDLLAFGPVDDLLPERLFLPEGAVDLIWLPTQKLDEPEKFAAWGVVPHRLLTSRVVHDRTGRAERQARLVAERMFDPAIQAKRIAGLLTWASGPSARWITWDYPPLALFWLHIAYAACLAALSTAHASVPQHLLRPFDTRTSGGAALSSRHRTWRCASGGPGGRGPV